MWWRIFGKPTRVRAPPPPGGWPGMSAPFHHRRAVRPAGRQRRFARRTARAGRQAVAWGATRLPVWTCTSTCPRRTASSSTPRFAPRSPLPRSRTGCTRTPAAPWLRPPLGPRTVTRSHSKRDPLTRLPSRSGETHRKRVHIPGDVLTRLEVSSHRPVCSCADAQQCLTDPVGPSSM